MHNEPFLRPVLSKCIKKKYSCAMHYSYSNQNTSSGTREGVVLSLVTLDASNSCWLRVCGFYLSSPSKQPLIF